MRKNNFSGTILKDKLKDISSEAAYILKSDVFEDEYDLLLSCFKEYYDSVNIAYSFKTNYIPNFLNIVKNKKGYAEVVSIMELELALKIGFLPQNIFFNGPLNVFEELESQNLKIKFKKLSVKNIIKIDSSQINFKCKIIV